MMNLDERFARRLEWPWRLLLMLVIGLASMLRWYRIGAQDLWYDEACSVYLMDHLSQLTGDYQPPLYYVMLREWSAVFGYSETALRSLSTVGSVLIIPIVGQIARRMADVRVALISMLFVAYSPFQIWYAQEARGYAWMTCFVTVMLWCWWCWSEQPKARGWWWGMLLSALAAVGTGYGAGYFLLTLIGMTFIWGRPEQRRAICVLVGGVAVGCLPYLSLFLTHWSHVARGWFWLPSVDYQGVWRAFGEMVLGYENVTAVESSSYTLLFLVGCVVALRQRPKVGRALLAWTVVPVMMALLLSLWRPLFIPRQLMPVTITWWIVVAIGVAEVWSRLRHRPIARLSLAVFVMGFALQGLRHQYIDVLPRAKPPYRPALQYIRRHWQTGDILAHTIPMTVFPSWYYARELQPSGKLMCHVSASGDPDYVDMFWGYNHHADAEAVGTYGTFTQLLGERHHRLWVLHGSWERDGAFHPDGLNVRRWLRRQEVSVAESLCIGDLLVERYDRVGSGMAVLAPR